MKRIFLLMLVSFIPFVFANEPVTMVSLTNKCVVYTGKKAIINVNVIALNDGNLVKLIPKYTLGKISNDNIAININEITGDGIKGIEVDTVKDSNGLSNMYFYLDDDIKLKKLDSFLNFNVEVNFEDSVPRSINVLGNEIFLSNSNEVCERINEHNNEQIVIVKDNTFYIYLFILLGGVITIILVIFIKRRMKV